jgi:hypothetical protein
LSSFHAIWTASRALQQILWEAFDADNVLRGIVGSAAAIVLSNPTDVQRDPANRLSLWLYQITENEYVKNQLPTRSTADNRMQMPPLALNLFYLVTPFAGPAEADQLLLGKIMQVLYDNAIVTVRNVPDNDFEELRIVLCRLTLEELTRIWEALREPYRLSVCYQIRVTHVDSERDLGRARVIDRIASIGDTPSDLEVRP